MTETKDVFNVGYHVANGTYQMHFYRNNKWSCGGDSKCSTKEDALKFANKIIKGKGGVLGKFYKEPQ